MTKNTIKRASAILLILFFAILFILIIYFGLIGKTAIALSLFVFNGFFTVVVYFLLRMQRSVDAGIEEFLKHDDTPEDDDDTQQQ